MGIVERKEREREQLRLLILETALDLYREGGEEGVTLRRIAERIEYSPTTIYLYFKDKDELYYHLHCWGFEKLVAYQQVGSHLANPIERLKLLGTQYLKFGLENPELYDIMFMHRGPIRTIEAYHEDWKHGSGAYNILLSTVEEVIATGKTQEKNTDLLAFFLWSGVHGMVSLAIRSRLPMLEGKDLNSLMHAVSRFMASSVLTASSD
jgi:AcrR family transcriptional regulator